MSSHHGAARPSRNDGYRTLFFLFDQMDLGGGKMLFSAPVPSGVCTLWMAALLCRVMQLIAAMCLCKVVFLRNYGMLVMGDTVEEAFLTATNVMAAVDTQVTLAC